LSENRAVKYEMKMFNASGWKQSYVPQNNIPLLNKPISTGTK
jgi:hypothetical protein